jgi:hypothetical protein
MPIEDMPTGIMRGRFHPQDGQLYACGLFAWAGDKTAPGGFYRIRYKGEPVEIPTALHATQRGMVIRFTRELDPETAADAGSYSVSRWQYRRTKNYGSDDYKISAPEEKGRDRVKVTEAKLSADGKAVLLVIPDMRTAQQMQIRYNISAADGARIRQEIMNTVHRLGEEEREIVWRD